MTVTEKLNGYGPLAGIKVVEMCTYVAAPATVRVLSEMGAEVIKIESFAGDTQRTQGPGFGCELTDTEDPTIDLNNTNKNWVSLNLKDPEGLAIAKKMIGEADIFMKNMRTAALQNLGLDSASYTPLDVYKRQRSSFLVFLAAARPSSEQT